MQFLGGGGVFKLKMKVEKTGEANGNFFLNGVGKGRERHTKIHPGKMQVRVEVVLGGVNRMGKELSKTRREGWERCCTSRQGRWYVD